MIAEYNEEKQSKSNYISGVPFLKMTVNLLLAEWLKNEWLERLSKMLDDCQNSQNEQEKKLWIYFFTTVLLFIFKLFYHIPFVFCLFEINIQKNKNNFKISELLKEFIVYILITLSGKTDDYFNFCCNKFYVVGKIGGKIQIRFVWSQKEKRLLLLLSLLLLFIIKLWFVLFFISILCIFSFLLILLTYGYILISH